MQKPISPMPSEKDGFLREFANKNELADLFGVSARTIERWVRLRTIPKPVQLGRRSLFHLPTIREVLTKAASSGSHRPPRTRR